MLNQLTAYVIGPYIRNLIRISSLFSAEATLPFWFCLPSNKSQILKEWICLSRFLKSRPPFVSRKVNRISQMFTAFEKHGWKLSGVPMDHFTDSRNHDAIFVYRGALWAWVRSSLHTANFHFHFNSSSKIAENPLAELNRDQFGNFLRDREIPSSSRNKEDR